MASEIHGNGDECPKCLKVVERLENAPDPNSESAMSTGHGADAPPVYVFEYLPIKDLHVCQECRGSLSDNRLDRIGLNLQELHDSGDKFSDHSLLPNGCSLCTLVLQASCAQSRLHLKCVGQHLDDVNGLTKVISGGPPILFVSPRHGDIYHWFQRYNRRIRKSATRDKKLNVLSIHKADWPRIESWIHKCETSHKGNCDNTLFESDSASSPYRFFIDVKRKKLTRQLSSCRYIALSYVWGNVSQLHLAKANKTELFLPGSLQRMESKIPQVIKDAMQIAAELKHDFLWVDSLCIIQDDEIIKHQLIQEMALVYDHATLTIIATNGRDANDGLPRVLPYDQLPEHSIDLKDVCLRLGSRRSLKESIDSSVYNTRAWTFQERLLSRRCLYFTDTQIFFECQIASWSEDRFGKEVAGSGNLVKRDLVNFGGVQATREEQQLLRYGKIVEEYSQKQLTFPLDVLDAFSGISAVMEKLCNWTTLSGLPKELLDQTIIWEQDNSTSLRVPDGRSENDLFPSWSWAAWTGGVKYNEWMVSELKIFHSRFKIDLRTDTRLQRASSKSLHPHVLAFSSDVVPCSRLSFKALAGSNRLQQCMVFNSVGRCIGTVPGNAEAIIKLLETENLDLALLSASSMAVHRFGQAEDYGAPSFFTYPYTRHPWSVLTVMIVRRQEKYSYRVALAYIHQAAWKEAHPEKQKIRLA